MGLFDGNYTSSNDDLALAPKAGDGKLYNMIRLAAITVILIAAVLLILEIPIFGILELGTTANGIIISIGVVGVGGFVALPWVRVFESFKDKRYKITAIAFLAMVGVCVILWIVCAWLIVGLIDKGMSGANEDILKDLLSSLNVIRVAIIISLQFIVASYIAKNIIKYNKTLLPYQVLAGASQLYIDFYVCLLLTAVTITVDGAELSSTAVFLTNMWVHALLAIFIVIAIFPNMVFRRVDRRRLLEARAAAQNGAADDKPVADNATTDTIKDSADNVDNAPVDEKLNKIKELLDKGLITQEEYDKKREDILNSI
ncbi:MAG: SHOCT domain-containing protein [Clostridiales bacterium]|nr:SHOCT domain-containing protein [Clostridiales bacterium]